MMRSTRRDDGFALAGLICILSAAVVLTAVMVPLWVMQSRRETEQELIFRGQEYIRAIQKYQRKYGVYPSSVDDLVSRDGYRFIRRQYKDPVTGEDFRLINVNADGSLTGSLTLLSLPVSNQQNGAPGTMPAANGTSPLSGGGGGGAGGGNNAQGNTGRNGVQNSASTSGVGTISGAGGSMGTSSNSGVSGISNPMSGGGTNANANSNSRAGVGGGGVGSGVGTGGGAFGGGGATGGGGAPGTLAAGAGAFGPMTNPMNGGGNTQAQGNNTSNRPGGTTAPGGGVPGAGAPSALANNAGFATGGGGGGLGGGGGAAAQISPGVAGVASESTKTAVMIYNEKEKYNEWEFISPLIQNQNQGANNQQGGANGQQQGANANRQQGNPPTSPFGQNPTGFGTNPLSGGSRGTGAGNPPAGNAPTTGGTGGARR